MNIDCNHHVASFSREQEGIGKRDKLTERPLGLEGNYTFVYTYPLSTAARFNHPLISSVGSIDILLRAKADYERIYAEEEAAVGETPNIPGMLNRDRSCGPYGIWGHCLSDLYFEQIEINTEKKIITFCIGS